MKSSHSRQISLPLGYTAAASAEPLPKKISQKKKSIRKWTLCLADCILALASPSRSHCLWQSESESACRYIRHWLFSFWHFPSEFDGVMNRFYLHMYISPLFYWLSFVLHSSHVSHISAAFECRIMKGFRWIAGNRFKARNSWISSNLCSVYLIFNIYLTYQ